MLANFHPDEAQRLRQLLVADHGDGDELMMSVGAVMSTSDETMVTDSNKYVVVCRKVRILQRSFCSMFALCLRAKRQMSMHVWVRYLLTR